MSDQHKPLFSDLSQGANPQAENGHIDIANEIAEALMRINFSAYESRILWAIFRKTYGWHKKEDRIALRQFQKLTGIDRPHTHRTLCRLIKRNIIVAKRGNSRILTYGFQKDYTRWKSVAQIGNIAKRGNRDIARIGNGVLPKEAPTKEIFTNENITKEKDHSPSLKTPSTELAVLLRDLIKEKHPKLKEPNLQAWAKVIDKMISLDNWTPEEIEQVIRWSQADEFWQVNILSTQKLREQFDQLWMKMKRKPKGVNQDGIDKGIQRLKDAFSGQKPKGIEHKPG